MEHCGENLRTVYMQASFDLHVIPFFMKQMMSAVVCLHQQDIIHCNLNPLNVFCTVDNHVRLMGFDEARVDRVGFRSEISNREALAHGLHVGELLYRAPEILMGFTKFSVKVDLWSLGCILAELFTKETLFIKDNIDDVLDEIFEVLGGAEDKDAEELSVFPGWLEKFTFEPPLPGWTSRFSRDVGGASFLSSLVTLSPSRLSALGKIYFKILFKTRT